MTARFDVVRAVWWLAGAVVVLGAALARLVSEGRSELAASDAAWAAGDALGATVHARAAARAYVPWAPHVPAAYRRLRTVAQDSEAKGDPESALFAWRALRAAAIGSRSWLAPRDREREVAEAAIVRLSAATRAPAARFDRTGAEATRLLASQLAVEGPPHVWGALMVVGAALWVVAGFRLTSRARDGERSFRLAALRAPVALAAAGLVAWWVALFLA